MAQLSQDEIDIVEKHRFKDALNTFCHKFASDHNAKSDPTRVVDDLTSQPFAVVQDTLLDLISTLLIQPAARALRSRTVDGPLRTDIASLDAQLSSNYLDTRLFRPLLKHVLTGSSDIEIWEAVYKLIQQTKESTPPLGVPSDVLHTPSKPSSSSQSALDFRVAAVEQRIREELRDCVYDNVDGFFDRFFEGKPWTDRATETCKRSKEWYTGQRWMDWPEIPEESQVLDWLQLFQERVLGGHDRTYYTSRRHNLLGTEIERPLDHFLAPADAPVSAGKYDWSNVLVVGELKKNPQRDREEVTLVQLAGYAREVFGSQPGRRFTHGYTLCGSKMRLYMFDRSGAYSSPSFDIHQHPDRFVKVLVGYMLMSKQELGINTYIKHDDLGRYILSHEQKLYLEDQPIASQNAIVCRGTTCFRGKQINAQDWQYVIKLSWPSAKRRREGELLKVARDRGVQGIAKWIDHQDIVLDGCSDTIATLRQGLIFSQRHQTSKSAAWVDGIGRQSGDYSKKPSFKKGSSLSKDLRIKASIASSSSRKRKRAQHTEASAKKPRSCESLAGSKQLRPQPDASGEEGVQSESASYSSAQEPQPDSLMTEEDEAYGDRAHCCLVVSPAGRPLHEFKSVREFLITLRDAVSAHKSLWTQGKILHRDISENNIVIAGSGADSRGVLIDLDLAKEQGSSLSGARHRTGTMQFMAIEVLKGISHTYRHDLESLFYVFVWICVRYRSTKESREASILHPWYSGSFQDIAHYKRGIMEKGGFKDVVAEFSSTFQPAKLLAQELRGILFPMSRDGELFTGTPPAKDCDKMYDRMIDAFNGTIQNLQTG